MAEVLLHKEFRKSELFDIADELDLDVEEGLRSLELSDLLVEDIETNGVPEPEECSDLMFEFLVVAGFVDEDGEIIEYVEEEEETEEINYEEMPECFSLADDRDPACNRCKVFEICMKERIANRPKCFGRLYSPNAEECKNCLEALYCKPITEQKEK